MTVGDSCVNPVQHLPEQVTQVKKETIKAFPHSKRVGGYLLGQTLGVGSFAKVKEGLHLVTGAKVAVKIIDKKRAKTDNYVRKNLRREGKLLQLIRHPNVVSLLEVMETDNSYYLVTEMCRGGDLMEYISAKKRLPEAEVATFIRQIISAVDYLHRMGIIHRDLKIENLLLDENKNIKLIDFGLSNFIKVADSPEGTQAQEFCVTQCGSPAYAAPELLNHEKYGLQVDLWSIGVNMYAMLTGGLPFTVEPFNIKALYAKMKDRQMNPLPESLSRDCRDLLLKFLTPDPAKRVTIAEALNHPWIMQGNKPLPRHPCPNRMRASDLDADILSHMSDNLNFRMAEVIKFVTSNIPSSACATYHLYHEKLRRYNADLRSRGLVPSASTSRSVKDGHIIFHLQDTWTEGSKEQPPPIPAPSDDVFPVKIPDENFGNTEINVTTTSTTNLKTGARTSAERRNKDHSVDRKVSRNSTFRYDLMKFNSNEHCNQPSPDITLLSNSNPSSKVPRHTAQVGKEVLPQVKSEMTTPRNIGQLSTENICQAKLIHNRKANPDKNDTENMKDKFNFAYIQFQSKKSGSSPTEFQYPSRQVKHEAINMVSEENLSYNSEVTQDSNLKFTSINSEQYHNNSLLKDNISNLENVQPNHSRRYVQNNRLLARRGVIKTIDLNASSSLSDKNVSTVNGGFHNCKLVRHSSPASNKSTPKQIKPFHSAHERPKLSETCPPHFLKQAQKAKCSESMILQGKNLLNTAYSEDFTSSPKSTTSPPLKPAVVRRKLAKRHRFNELTPSGNIIQDQVIMTDLLESDAAEFKPGTEENGRLTSSLPSISPHVSG